MKHQNKPLSTLMLAVAAAEVGRHVARILLRVSMKLLR